MNGGYVGWLVTCTLYKSNMPKILVLQNFGCSVQRYTKYLGFEGWTAIGGVVTTTLEQVATKTLGSAKVKWGHRNMALCQAVEPLKVHTAFCRGAR